MQTAVSTRIKKLYVRRVRRLTRFAILARRDEEVVGFVRLSRCEERAEVERRDRPRVPVCRFQGKPIRYLIAQVIGAWTCPAQTSGVDCRAREVMTVRGISEECGGAKGKVGAP
mgnify:CR=1 FL=1|jgi:hypothetical protein